MSDPAMIAAAVGPVVEAWLRGNPSQPLVLSVVGGSVACRVGLVDDSALTGKAAADLLGVSYRHFARRGFFGLSKGPGGKFSRLQVERLAIKRRG